MITSGFSAIHSRLDMVNSYSKMRCSKAMLVYQRVINLRCKINEHVWMAKRLQPPQGLAKSSEGRARLSNGGGIQHPGCGVILCVCASSGPFLKDVSQNCFVFDFVNLQNWGRLAELLRFWCCQVQKLWTSRRIASFLMLSSSKA